MPNTTILNRVPPPIFLSADGTIEPPDYDPTQDMSRVVFPEQQESDSGADSGEDDRQLPVHTPVAMKPYMIRADRISSPPQISAREKKALRNRFYVAKAYMAKVGGECLWNSFNEWFKDFMIVAPTNFSLKTHTVRYADRLMSVDTMAVAEKKEARKLRAERALRVIEEDQEYGISTPRQDAAVALHPLEKYTQEQLAIFTSELTRRLLRYNIGDTLEQVLQDAAQSAGL